MKYHRPFVYLTLAVAAAALLLNGCSEENGDTEEAAASAVQTEAINWNSVKAASSREGTEALFQILREADHYHAGNAGSIELRFVPGEGPRDQDGNTYSVTAEEWKVMVQEMQASLERRPEAPRVHAMSTDFYSDALGDVRRFEYRVSEVTPDELLLETVGAYSGG